MYCSDLRYIFVYFCANIKQILILTLVKKNHSVYIVCHCFWPFFCSKFPSENSHLQSLHNCPFISDSNGLRPDGLSFASIMAWDTQSTLVLLAYPAHIPKHTHTHIQYFQTIQWKCATNPPTLLHMRCDERSFFIHISTIIIWLRMMPLHIYRLDIHLALSPHSSMSIIQTIFKPKLSLFHTI